MNVNLSLQKPSEADADSSVGTKRRPLVRHNALLWGLYLLLALILTWPAARYLTSHLPGDGGDDPAIAWNIWWVNYALLNEGQNPFQSDFMFYPVGINLAFYTLTVLNALSALPLLLNWGTITASNLHMLFTFVVGGFGAFLLARDVLTHALASPQAPRPTTSSLADIRPKPKEADDSSRASSVLIWGSAAIAGGIYTFAANKLFYISLGQFNIASSHWVPFAVLYILRTHRQPSRLKNPLMAALFFTFQTWSEMTFASFLIVFLVIYIAYWLFEAALKRLVRRPQPAAPADQPTLWQASAPYIRAGLVFGALSLVGVSPILAQMIPDLLAEGDFMVEGSGFADAFSADLLGFIIPTMHHPLLGDLIAQTNISGYDKGQHIYLGLILLGLATITLVSDFRRPQVRFWLFAALIFGLLSLGPTISINGYDTAIEGPFTILQQLPIFKANRYPSRFSVMLVLCLSVIAGFGLVRLSLWARHITWLKMDGRQYLPLVLAAGIFLFEHLATPVPLSDMRLPPAYQIIASDPTAGTVLDIPFAWRNGFRITGALTTKFMFGQFYQTSHQKPLLQGNTSRNPEFKFQYFTSAPLINSLLTLETGKTLPADRWDTDKKIAGEVLRFFGVTYIVVRSNNDQNPAVTPQETVPYIEAILPVKKIYDHDALIIYQVLAEPHQANFHIDPASPLASLYFGEGWGLLRPDQPFTAQRRSARLMLPLTAAAHHLTLRARLPEAVGTSERKFALELNGWQSDAREIGPDWPNIALRYRPARSPPA